MCARAGGILGWRRAAGRVGVHVCVDAVECAIHFSRWNSVICNWEKRRITVATGISSDVNCEKGINFDIIVKLEKCSRRVTDVSFNLKNGDYDAGL